MSNTEKPGEGELFRLATDIKRVSKIVKKKIILSFHQKVREECVKNVGPADISTCEECINWEDCEVNVSICFEGSTEFLLPYEWTDKQLTAYIEKVLGGERIERGTNNA